MVQQGGAGAAAGLVGKDGRAWAVTEGGAASGCPLSRLAGEKRRPGERQVFLRPGGVEVRRRDAVRGRDQAASVRPLAATEEKKLTTDEDVRGVKRTNTTD
jgi:hypothetical protein